MHVQLRLAVDKQIKQIEFELKRPTKLGAKHERASELAEMSGFGCGCKWTEQSVAARVIAELDG